MEIPLIALAVALIGPAPYSAPYPTSYSTYVCRDDSIFTLSTSNEMAIVRFKDGEYRLPRRQSAIAIKYATDQATLYLDGDFAAFVADDRPLPGCHRVKDGDP